MSLWSLTKEKVEELIKQRDTKGREVNDLKRKSPSDLWKEDLAAFVEELDKVEAQEREDILAGMSGKAVKGKVGKAKVKKLQLEETMPSPYGRRIVPEITAMKADASRKLLKKKKGDPDTTVVKVEFDEEFSGTPVEGTGEETLTPSAPVNKGPKPKREKKEPGTRVRRTPASTGKPNAKKVKKRNPWSDDESKSESDLEEAEPVVIPRDSLLRRAAAERPKYTFDFSEEEEDDADDDDDNNDLEELKVKASPITNDGEDEFVPSDGIDKDEYAFSPGKSKATPEKSSHDKKSQDFGNLFSFPSYSQKSEDDSAKFDSNEEDTTSVFAPSFGLKQTDKVPSQTVAAKKGKAPSDAAAPKAKRAPRQRKVVEPANSDSDSELGSIPKKTAAPKGKGRGAKKRKASGSENEGDYNPGRKPSKTASKKPKKTSFDQDSDVDIFPSDFTSEPPALPRTARARKEVKYFAESDEEEDVDFAMFN